MSPVKALTRSTRQATTRASITTSRESGIEAKTSSEALRRTPSPDPKSRSRRSTSPISSLSPSPQKIAHKLPAPAVTSSVTRQRRDKGKGKAVELPQVGSGGDRPGKRVLPARIRRAAGGGQEGFRDLEDIIVDWLDRYGYPSDTPPDHLRITITSLPLDLVDPPITFAKKSVEATEQVTITPNEAGPSTVRGMIETPDWIKVDAGQDDREEAREELISRGPVSPIRRLRRLSNSNEHGEDTSDEYYHRLHKKYEAIEKRQRKDERDKLAFERYKMRTRIDLLGTISSHSWSSVVWTVLARDDPTGLWDKGKSAVRNNGIEWLRRRLVKEGEEVMKRYDKMLPVDPRKSKVRDRDRDDKSIVFMSQSPPPAGLPARVAALKILKDEAADRRKSLPAQRAAADPGARKRRRSEGNAQLLSTRSSGPRPTITVRDEDELSDTDSEPLSDAPPESDSESDLIEAVALSTINAAPSSVTSTDSHISVLPHPPTNARETRMSTRAQAPRSSLSRKSARIRLPVSAGPTPAPLEAPQPDTRVEMPSTTDEIQWGVFDQDSKPLDIELDYLANGTEQIQDQLSLDEQMDLERVEAAVVI